MPIQLEIQDGDPWYLSPNIWTVPGNDPEGAPNAPVAGQPCYLWAKIRNNGDQTASNAAIRFYWANPAVGINRYSANLIGTSYVTLSPGQESDVLCLTPWIPSYVNKGHECVIAEVFHAADPLPAGPDFNVPTDRHVAQRNLAVYEVAPKQFFHFSFEIHNATRRAQDIVVKWKQGKVEGIRKQMEQLGVKPGNVGRIRAFGFTQSPCPEADEIKQAVPELKLSLRPHERSGASFVGELEGQAALVEIEQFVNDHVVGGLAALILEKNVPLKKEMQEC